nr:chromate efflux transporter [Aliidiomarina taiwanensis]
MSQNTHKHAVWSVFWAFLKLGFTSFGGPVAHLGYFRHAFVSQRAWLSEQSYADLVALCQFLPGPASSQVGIAIGYTRAGYRGALAAWLGFTVPSAVALIAIALSLQHFGDTLSASTLHAFKLVAVAVVAQALLGMARTLCPDLPRVFLMLAAALCMFFIPTALGQVTVIAAAAVIGWLCFQSKAVAVTQAECFHIPMRRRAGVLWFSIFAFLLLSLPFFASTTGYASLTIIDAFYRAGALVFGGGHVVLPLLQAEVVATGWVSHDSFIAGYGVTQAVPGPLFTFAAFLGASLLTGPTGWLGGTVALLAIFLPSFLLVFAALPFWQHLRQQRSMQAALVGINAAVVGLLLAAFFQPVLTSAIHSLADVGFAALFLFALMYWRVPPWCVVLISPLIGVLLSFL